MKLLKMEDVELILLLLSVIIMSINIAFPAMWASYPIHTGICYGAICLNMLITFIVNKLGLSKKKNIYLKIKCCSCGKLNFVSTKLELFTTNKFSISEYFLLLIFV